MKRSHKRAFMIFVFLALIGSGAGIILYTLKNYVSFYQTPTEVVSTQTAGTPHKKWRLGGYVKKGSIIELSAGIIQFVATDGQTDITVTYQGQVPQLFREGQGVVVDGTFANNRFTATQVLAKHDEVYTAKKRALKGSQP